MSLRALTSQFQKRASAMPTFDPDNFVTGVDNPLYPLLPGTTYINASPDGVFADNLTVTRDTIEILGVGCIVVDDRAYEDGELVERTLDYFAQDKQGNVWYLGEFVKNYENGKVVDNDGSWEAGVDGAIAGIVMPAKPEVGMKYQQEFYEGEAEDRGEVLSLDKTVTVPFGTFDNVLETEDTTPLEPAVREHKYYAKGIGVALVVDVAGGGREELVRFVKGAG